MYMNPAEPVEARIGDLLGRMTLREKIAQLGSTMPTSLCSAQGLDPAKMRALLKDGIGQISAIASFGNKPPVRVAELANGIQRHLCENTRLGIPAIIHNEALNGLVAPGVPNFPTPIGLAATWEPDLILQMADLVRRQMRRIGIHQALSPVMDVARDARWGRVHETYGEDPYLCTACSVAFVKGMQGHDLKEGVIATGKHFLGYSLSEAGQNMAATHIGDRELYEVFARPFEAAIREAGLASIMNSYSDLDGVPIGSSSSVLTDLLRGTLGFEGVVVSDYKTILWLMSRQGTADTLQAAGIQALSAGLDVELPGVEGFGENLVQAVENGLISESVVDRSVRRVLQAKFRLGLFENPYVCVADMEGAFTDRASRELSAQLARKSLTLLKNEGRLLPLGRSLASIAVIGPHADAVNTYFPGYTYPGAVELMRSRILDAARDRGGMAGVSDEALVGQSEALKAMIAEMGDILTAGSVDEYIRRHYPAESVLEAITRVAPSETRVLYRRGCDVLGDDASGIPDAVEAARGASVAILALGGKCGWLAGGTEGEGRDTANLDLPALQQKLLEAVVGTGTPAIVILFGGRPYTIAWAAENVPAILAVYYPGQEGGAAIAGALFGDFSPGGRLPYSIPRHAGQVPIYHYHKRGSGYRRTEADIHKGYTDMPSTPLYHFGHGLSYTSFGYSNLVLSATKVDSRGAVDISCDVTNAGETRGDEVVQLYVHDREATITRPVNELAGFKRVTLDPGETCTITFQVQMSQLGFFNRAMEFAVEPGQVDVMIGSSSADIRLTSAFEITGDVVSVLGARSFLSAVSVARRHDGE